MNDADWANKLWFEKDRHGRYKKCSEQFAEAAGEDSPNHIIGKTDNDLVWRNGGNTCDQSDKKVLTELPALKQNEWIRGLNGWVEVTTIKTREITPLSNGITGSLITVNSAKAPLINEYCQHKSLFIPCIRERITQKELLVLRYVVTCVPIREAAKTLKCSESIIYKRITTIKKSLTSKPTGT